MTNQKPVHQPTIEIPITDMSFKIHDRSQHKTRLRQITELIHSHNEGIPKRGPENSASFRESKAL